MRGDHGLTDLLFVSALGSAGGSVLNLPTRGIWFQEREGSLDRGINIVR